MAARNTGTKKAEAQKKEEKNPSGGRKPLPSLLKVLFVILVLGVLSSLASIRNAQYILFGFQFGGIPALLAMVLLDIIGAMVLLFGLWKKPSWAWKYGLAYLGFLVINGAVSLAQFVMKAPSVSGQAGVVAGVLVFTIFVYAVFLFALFMCKKFFEG